jgi:hypothetical protein
MKKYLRLPFIILVNILITCILLELSTPFIYHYLTKVPFNKSRISQKLHSYTASDTSFSNQNFASANFIENKAIHPYLGFVYDTKKDISKREDFFGFGNTQGILDNSDKVKVVITGGSVAQGLYRNASSKIIYDLQHSEQFKNKEIQLFDLSIGGFKQPQQLMTLNYFLMLGAKFDIWINLDGFNEVTLPISENWYNKVAYFYPRLWNFYARKSLDKNILDKMIDLKIIRRSRLKLSSLFVPVPIDNSSFTLALWDILDNKYALHEYQANKELNALMAHKKPTYQVSGPVSSNKQWPIVLRESAKLWARSSQLMAGICKENDIKYYHFLQPNQYVKGSKKLTSEEKAIAYEEGNYDFKTLVKAGYPLLKQESNKLTSSGVNYFDLTMIFKNEKDSVYADKCCHFNNFGYKTIAGQITDAIRSDY